MHAKRWAVLGLIMLVLLGYATPAIAKAKPKAKTRLGLVASQVSWSIGKSTVTATLKSGKKPLKGKSVKFWRAGVLLKSAKTNKKGQASVVATGGWDPVPVSAKFGGDKGYRSSNASATIRPQVIVDTIFPTGTGEIRVLHVRAEQMYRMTISSTETMTIDPGMPLWYFNPGVAATFINGIPVSGESWLVQFGISQINNLMFGLLNTNGQPTRVTIW